MLQCAFQQGHGAAAYRLGIQAEGQGRYRDALQLYQDGTKFGSRECATGLYLLFDDGFWANSSDEKKQALREIGIFLDSERARRYLDLSRALQINPDLKFSRLDLVLPLPPAKLPHWTCVDDALEPESTAPPTY